MSRIVLAIALFFASASAGLPSLSVRAARLRLGCTLFRASFATMHNAIDLA